MPSHNPFRESWFEKRTIAVVDSRTENAHPLYLPVRIEPKNNGHAATYIPENERFSIQSILGLGQPTTQSQAAVDNNLHRLTGFSDQAANNQGRSDTYSRSTPPVAMVKPQPNMVPLQQHTSPAERRFAMEHSAFEDPIHMPARCEMDSSGNFARASVEVSDENSHLQTELRTDPDYAEQKKERQKMRRRQLQKERYQNDPVYAERERERKRELRKDPAYAERERAKNRKYYQNNPTYAERQKERSRERQKELRKHKGPVYLEHEKQRKRTRYQNNPPKPEGQQISIDAYVSIKSNPTDKEEVSNRQRYMPIILVPDLP
ncbi:hypothetical protein [Endozoicomonas sp. SESOKO1]|uniref:hypothetical protein n=1 Tax=Endozoicomonas sp. SESOKO1 TaxID=2828742 RepID=UPI0021483F0F|nr:hypothetical protein [Endozoicomonas sp. SESOKO1]